MRLQIRRGKDGRRLGTLRKEDHEWHWVRRAGKIEDLEETAEYLSKAGFMAGNQVAIDVGVGRRMMYPEQGLKG